MAAMSTHSYSNPGTYSQKSDIPAHDWGKTYEICLFFSSIVYPMLVSVSVLGQKSMQFQKANTCGRMRLLMILETAMMQFPCFFEVGSRLPCEKKQQAFRMFIWPVVSTMAG